MSEEDINYLKSIGLQDREENKPVKPKRGRPKGSVDSSPRKEYRKETKPRVLKKRKVIKNRVKPTPEMNMIRSEMMKGNHLSEETKRKISQSMMGHSYKGKKVEMLDPYEGTVIRVFNSVKEASEFFGVNKSNISSACHGRINYSCGYKWRYLDD